MLFQMETRNLSHLAHERYLRPRETTHNIQQIGTLPVDSKQLYLETSNDPLLSKVLRYTKEGWPQEVDAQLCPFFRRKLEITNRVWLSNVGY